MIRMITAELLVLRKRVATWILLGLWTLLAVFFAYVIPYALDPEDAVGGLNELLPQSLAGNLIAGFPFFGGVFALMLGVFAIGSEYGWDTLKTLFTQGPGRLRAVRRQAGGARRRSGPVRARAVRGRRRGQLRHRADRGRPGPLAVSVVAGARARRPAG